MTLLQYIFAEKELTGSVHEDALKTIGWYINNDADYVDLETEVSYRQSDNEAWDYDSFNLAATFDLQQKILYFIFGNNLGEGLIEAFEFRYTEGADMKAHFLERKASCANKDFITLMDAHSEDVDVVIEQLDKLITLIQQPV